MLLVNLAQDWRGVSEGEQSLKLFLAFCIPALTVSLLYSDSDFSAEPRCGGWTLLFIRLLRYMRQNCFLGRIMRLAYFLHCVINFA